MDAKLILAPEAEKDLTEAYQWYEEKRAGLGESFLRVLMLACMSLDACLRCTRRFSRILGGE